MTMTIRRGDRILAIILFIALVLSSGFYFLSSRPGDQLIAVVVVNGQEVKRIDLSTVQQPFEFTLRTGNNQESYNIIQVEKGRIRVREANCPEQVDVKQGWLDRAGQSAVCLPHRVVVRVISNKQPSIDGISV